MTPGDSVRLRHFFGPAGRCAVSLLNEAAQMRFDGTMSTRVGVSKDEERVPKDIDEAMNEYEASYRIEGSNRTAGANGIHTETTSQPLSDHDTGIQSDDVEMSENVAMAERRSPTEAESIDEIKCAIDISTEIADEPHAAKDSDSRPTLILQALEADSGARLDEESLNMNCTPTVGATFEDRAVLAMDSSPKEPRGSILAELGSDFRSMDTDREENDAIHLFSYRTGKTQSLEWNCK